MRKTLCFLSLLVAFCPTVLSGTIDPSVPDSKYVEYGAKYQCVLPICGILGDKLNTQFKATCVVIDSLHILTAAHVVEGTITQHVLYKGKAYPCSIVAIHGDYDSKVMGQHDIAIAKLQRPIELDFYPKLYTDKDEVGKVCGLAGYGFHGDFNSGYNSKTYDNDRRAGSNIIDAVNKNVLKYSVHTEPKTTLEFLICPGDSGGGLFIDKKLAGIHSYVYATDGKSDSDSGDVGCSTRISDYIEWISKTKKIIEEIVKEQERL
tara:strand:- start:1314 stop:2099 length:786 start_codon:yes stop_codon:yes gene_type:complete